MADHRMQIPGPSDIALDSVRPGRDCGIKGFKGIFEYMPVVVLTPVGDDTR